MRRAVSRFSGVSTVGGPAPGDRLARQQQRLGKVRPHQIDVVQRREHGALLAVPALHQIEQVGRGLGVDGVERLVQHDHARRPAAAAARTACAASARPRACRSARPSKPVSPTAAIARSIASRVLAADAAEQAGALPQPHRHHVVDVDREAAVDLGGLRQIGDVLRLETPSRSMRPASGLSTPTMPLNSVDLPAPFGPTTAISAPVCDGAVEMMHGRMAVVAEREIAELQLRGHRLTFTPSPRTPRAQITAITAAATASRWSADSRRIDGATDAGG